MNNEINELKAEIQALKELIYAINSDEIEAGRNKQRKIEGLTPEKTKNFNGFCMFRGDNFDFIYNLIDSNFKIIDIDNKYKCREVQYTNIDKIFNDAIENSDKEFIKMFNKYKIGNIIFKIECKFDFNKKCFHLDDLKVLDVFSRESVSVNNYILDIETMRILKVYRDIIKECINIPVNQLDLHPTEFYNLLEKYHQVEDYILNNNENGWFPFIYYSNRFFKIHKNFITEVSNFNPLKRISEVGIYNTKDPRFISEFSRTNFIEPEMIYCGYAKFSEDDKEVELLHKRLVNYNKALCYENAPKFIKNIIDNL